MAYLKAEYSFVPRSEFLESSGENLLQILNDLTISKDDSFEASDRVYWKNSPQTLENEVLLQNFFGTSCKHDGWIRFETDNGDRVEISTIMMYCEIDTRNINHEFVQLICKLASENDSVLISSRTRQILEPDFNTLLKDIISHKY